MEERESRPIALEAVGITKTFRDPQSLTIFRDLSLRIYRGEFVALVGHSGCGKTTLLRVLAGLEQSDAGTVTVSGDGGPQTIGMVFQQPGLLAWRTVRENIRLPGDLLQNPDLEKRVDSTIELVGLNGFANYYPHQISGGMQARTAIARAVLTSSSILLIDEPFGALDEFTREELRDDLAKIWQKLGTSILFVTHSVEEAAALADRVLIMPARTRSSMHHFEFPNVELMEKEDFASTRRMEAVTEIRALLREGAHE